MMRHVVLILISLGCLFLSNISLSQKIIQLEKRGSFKTQKYYIGDILVYKLKSDPRIWLDEVIMDIYIQDGIIQFNNRAVYMDSIAAIRMPGGPGFRTAHLILKTFGYSWYFFTLVSLAYGESLTMTKVTIGGGALVVAWLLKQLFFKTHKIGKTKRLRLLDLTYYPVRTG